MLNRLDSTVGQQLISSLTQSVTTTHPWSQLGVLLYFLTVTLFSFATLFYFSMQWLHLATFFVVQVLYFVAIDYTFLTFIISPLASHSRLWLMQFFHYQFVLQYFDICGSFSNNTESTYSHRTTRLSPNAQLSVLPLYFAAGLSPSWGNQLNLLSSKMYPKWPLILGFHLFGKINFLSESELCWRIQFWAQSPPVSSPTS